VLLQALIYFLFNPFLRKLLFVFVVLRRRCSVSQFCVCNGKYYVPHQWSRRIQDLERTQEQQADRVPLSYL